MIKIMNVVICFLLLFNFIPNQVRAQESTLRLSLQQVTEMALKNNFEIQLAKYEAWIKQTDEMGALSIYDTILEAQAEYLKDKSAQPTTFAGTRNQENNYGVELTRKLSTGTQVSLDMANERNATNSSFSTSPVTYDSTVKLEVEQALGKNFFGILDRNKIKVTLDEIENTRYISLAKIERSLADVQKAYWDLVLHYEQIKIEEDLVEYAKNLYEHHKKQLEDGLVEAPDLLASKANYKRAQNILKLAENNYKRKENVLKLLLNKGDLDTKIHPVDQFSLPQNKLQTTDSLNKAFENRRDYKEAMNRVKTSDIQMEMAKNNLWPEINLTLSFARNGIGDQFKDSARAISENDDPEYFAGISVVFPLENREARSSLQKGELQKARLILNAKYVEKRISIGIIDQVRDCNVLKEVALNQVEIADLQTQKLEEELKRFNRGRSDTDIIVRYQEDASQARLSAARAKYDYYNSLISLKIEEASLLNEYWDESL